jgi:LPXTG-site transpeptidase (sortase) family protein
VEVLLLKAMKRHSSFSTILLLVVVLAALGVFAGTFRRAAMAPYTEPEITIAEDSIETTYHPATPERLIIPSLGVDAAVQNVGIGKSGHMAVPSNYTDVGWYRYGAKPGEGGNAVFAGHVDNGFGRSGVFRDLEYISRGQDIYVKTAEGTHIQYKVTDIKRVSADTSSTSTIFEEQGSSKIVLITCEGEWDPEKKTYSERLLITADLAA